MKHLPLIIEIFFIALFLLSLPSAVTAAPAARYDLDVSINIPGSEITGIARIEVSAHEDTVVRTGKLAITYARFNDDQTEVVEEDGTFHMIPDEDGILEISYTVTFKDISESGGAETGGNVIGPQGVSLTNTWYPEVEGLRYFRLKARLPGGYEAVSEAEDMKKTETDDSTEFLFDFPHPLDRINLIASNNYIVKKDTYDGTEIFAYFFKDDSSLADSYIEFTKKYLKLYEELLGQFPYKRFSVVENFLPTGYSFPTFTLLGNAVVRLPFIVETSLGHEILHQWFGNYVYVDYERGNWAEGLTTYLADHLYEEQKNKGWEYRKQILTDYKSYVTAENELPLRNFTGRLDLSTKAVGYGKAAMVFHMLRLLDGEQEFYNALKDVLREHPFRPVSWEDLKASFEKSYRQDLSWFFDQWVDGKGLPEIGIDDLSVVLDGSDYKVSFTVSQKTEVYRFTLPVNVYMGDKAVIKSLALDEEKQSFEFYFPERPDRIVFDENYDVARDLEPEEFAPVVARLLGDTCLLISVPPENAEMYSSFMDVFEGNNPVKWDENNIKDSDIKLTSLIVFGADNPIAGRMFGKIAPEDAGFSFVVKENPLNPQMVIGIVNGRSKTEVDAAAGKISHYGKYSRLLFDNGRNIAKEVERTERGMIMYMEEDAPVVDISAIKTLSGMIDGVADKKIIYVGEIHDQFAHHAVQLDVIKGIYRKNGKVAIGMEMFQRPFQPVLDSFIGGEMDEADFLKNSEYFKRWGFDYNLYKTFFDFARKEKIPVIALNLKREIIEKVSREGLDSLTAEEKEAVPQYMDFSDETYRERLYGIFRHHKDAGDRNFDFFYQSQLLWDETMSWSIDEFLRKNPEYQMVVLAGRGHLEYGSGIPKRTFRRNGDSYAIVLSDGPVDKDIADYVVYPNPLEGVVAPKLMVFISEEKEGIKITGFPEMSVTEKAGVKAGDIIVSFDGKEMKTIDDVKIQLVYKKPGDTVKLEVLRKEEGGEKKMVFDVTL